MKFFLLTYDPHAAGGPDIVGFDDEDSAFAELKRATLAMAPQQEVVLFRAPSIETLKETHSRYFYSAGEIVAQLNELTEQLRDDIRASLTKAGAAC